MNRNPLGSPQTRVGCAAAAVFASALVLSSVVWLFAANGTPAASAASAAPSQVLVSADGHVGSERARVR